MSSDAAGLGAISGEDSSEVGHRWIESVSSELYFGTHANETSFTSGAIRSFLNSRTTPTSTDLSPTTAYTPLTLAGTAPLEEPKPAPVRRGRNPRTTGPPPRPVDGC